MQVEMKQVASSFTSIFKNAMMSRSQSYCKLISRLQPHKQGLIL